jgi:hypothetical protein
MALSDFFRLKRFGDPNRGILFYYTESPECLNKVLLTLYSKIRSLTATSEGRKCWSFRSSVESLPEIRQPFTSPMGSCHSKTLSVADPVTNRMPRALRTLTVVIQFASLPSIIDTLFCFSNLGLHSLFISFRGSSFSRFSSGLSMGESYRSTGFRPAPGRRNHISHDSG